MEHYELNILADYTHTGTQAANTWARPSPRDVGGELERDEVAEVVFAEIVPPVTGANDAEVLQKVIPVLDGEKYGEYVSLSGIRDCLMAPMRDRIWAGKLYSFGTPMSVNPAQSTTLKYDTSITIEALAGGIAVDNDYRIRLWGYKYKQDELARLFGTMYFPRNLMAERARNRVVTISKAPIPVTADTWSRLPGGKDQGKPKINPLIRYAWNANATDGKSGDYQFRYDNGNVAESDENMYFDFDEKDALLVKGLGVRPQVPPTNLARAGLVIAGDHHPKGLMATTDYNNPFIFGHAYPNFPADFPLFYAIPRLEIPLLITGEKGMVVVQDSGASISAAALTTEPPTGVVVALTGTRVEMD